MDGEAEEEDAAAFATHASKPVRAASFVGSSSSAFAYAAFASSHLSAGRLHRVTNQSDKLKQLPKLRQLNDMVVDVMAGKSCSLLA